MLLSGSQGHTVGAFGYPHATPVPIPPITHPCALVARLALGARLALKHRKEKDRQRGQAGAHLHPSTAPIAGGATYLCPILPTAAWLSLGALGGTGHVSIEGRIWGRGTHGYSRPQGSVLAETPPAHHTHPVTFVSPGTGSSRCPSSPLCSDSDGAISTGDVPPGVAPHPKMLPDLHQAPGGRAAPWVLGGRGVLQGE